MDIKRPGKSKLKKRIRSGIIIIIGLAAVAGITFGLTKLKPAAPTLDRSTAVIDTVKRGLMLREVRGNGTLVPQLTRWVPAPADGRVEKILIQAGVEVGAGTVIVELSNPQMEQQAMDADFQVKAAEADQENLRVRLESDTMTQQSAIATINSEYSQAKLQLDTDEVLAKQGLVPELLLKISRSKVQDLANRLKAELKIAETQIKDVKLGQPVAVDTRNGVIQGKVSRIDPAAREGTFVVDAELTGPLPSSARPDLSVDGTIELERLINVLYVGRPAFGQGQQTVGLFRLNPDGQEAIRTQVMLGRTSVSTVEIVSGLREGDQVILSDTSSMDSYLRIRVR